ncbi:1954_t:CDS:2, partial [Acaulospora colombiana]
FKTLPKLAFHQIPTLNGDQQFIPSERSITLLYWTFVLATSILTLILSVLRATQSISILCFIKYGRLLVKLLEGSVRLSGVSDLVSPVNITSFEKYKVYVTK